MTVHLAWRSVAFQVTEQTAKRFHPSLQVTKVPAPMPARSPIPVWLDAPDPDAMKERLVRDFTTAYGRAPEVVAAAPGRLNLLGEHVDYNGGCCLALALPHVTLAGIARRGDGRVQVRSRQQAEVWSGTTVALGPGQAGGWARYVTGVMWALGELSPRGGADILVDGGVPMGAGLSSSAALEVAVAVALASVAGEDLSRPQLRAHLAEACIRAEQLVAGAPTGGLDQNVAMHARPSQLLALDFASGGRRHLPWAPEAAALSLLVVDTRVTHANNAGGFGQRRAECESAARALGVASLHLLQEDPERTHPLPPLLARRVRHVLGELRRVRQAVAFVEAGAPEALGPLLFAAHASLRDDFEVSCAELDLVVELAGAHGALGARMVGGGFGGSCVVLLPTSALGPFASTVHAAFVDRALEPPHFLEAPASGGARCL